MRIEERELLNGVMGGVYLFHSRAKEYVYPSKEERMKKVVGLICLFFTLVLFISAQEFGSIKGTVKDTNGDPLPGVNVSLTGNKIAPMTMVSSAEGNFRFLRLPVADDYILKLELDGFKTYVQEMINVSFGKDVYLDIILEQTAIEEEIVVVGKAPVIDTKRAQVGVNITQDMIMDLPTARNPWVLLNIIPGMLVDREDVGGNEGGQQSNYHGLGSSADDSTWSVDGANITDNSALGAAPAYLNISLYDEIQINYSNNDVMAQTGGVQINFVTQRGGNKYSGQFYLDVERKAWQADNVPDELKDIGYTAAGINRLYLYGASFGGPIIKDKAWFYGSWGIQDIDALALSGDSDKTWLVSGYFRLDFQITPFTRLNAFIEYDNKQKWGRPWYGYTLQDSDTLWNQIGPAYIWKGEVEQMFGNLYLDLKAIYTDGGFNLMPLPQKTHTADGSGDYMIYDLYPVFHLRGNTVDYGTNRDSLNINFNGAYFAENFLGADHELKFGADYMSATTSTFNLYEADLYLEYYGPDSTMPTGEYWAVYLFRDYLTNYNFNRFSAFVQDTISVGRFTFNLGLRYDQEKSIVKDLDIPAALYLSQYMPAVKIDEFDPGVKWQVLSPRFSVSYDIFGNGKDVIKFSVARYGSQSGNYMADFINPVGFTWIYLLWQDLNSDTRVTEDELFGYDWATDTLMDPTLPDYWIQYSGTVNPDDPTSIAAMNRFDPDYNSPLLDEVSLFYEKEILTDFAARLELFYKRYHHQTWVRKMLADGTLETADNYYVAGHDDTVDYDYYGRYEYYPYEYRTNYKNAYDRFLCAQLVLEKRLSNKWMMMGSFSWSDWKRFYEGEFLGILDPDNLAYDYGLSNQVYFDGGVVAPESSGSGLQDIFVNSRWQAKLSGLYQLPYGVNLSGVFIAREGYIKPTHVLVLMPGIGQEKLFGSDAGGGKFGDERLPTFYNLNLRMEKMFQLGDFGRVTFAVDAFNIFNSAVSLRKESRLDADEFDQDLRILNPRIFRFGIKFNF